MSDFQIWWNGFLSAAIIAALLTLGRGLWLHDANWIAPAGLSLFVGILLFIGTMEDIL